MGDDGCSASELRRRYHMGGDLKDDHLTAPQLRARYGIKKNTEGWCLSRVIYGRVPADQVFCFVAGVGVGG